MNHLSHLFFPAIFLPVFSVACGKKDVVQEGKKGRRNSVGRQNSGQEPPLIIIHRGGDFTVVNELTARGGGYRNKSGQEIYVKRAIETAMADFINNILDDLALISSYPASPEGRRNYLMNLVRKLKEGNADGLIYSWPAWISTGCSKLWEQVSLGYSTVFFNARTYMHFLPLIFTTGIIIKLPE